MENEPWVRVLYTDGDKADYNFKELSECCIANDVFLEGDYTDAEHDEEAEEEDGGGG